MIFTVSKTALQITIAIKEAAAADDPLKFLYDESGGAVATVFAVFFIPVATLRRSILAGIWAGINALRRKGIRAAIGAAAVAAGIIALTGFLYSATTGGVNGFRSIAGTVDTAISQVNAVATNALFDKLATGSGADPPDGPAEPSARSAVNGSPPARWPTRWPTGRGRSASSAAPASAPFPCPGIWNCHSRRGRRHPDRGAPGGKGAALLRGRGGGLPGLADLPHRPSMRGADR